jgi:hypothetical protein
MPDNPDKIVHKEARNRQLYLRGLAFVCLFVMFASFSEGDGGTGLFFGFLCWVFGAWANRIKTTYTRRGTFDLYD